MTGDAQRTSASGALRAEARNDRRVVNRDTAWPYELDHEAAKCSCASSQERAPRRRDALAVPGECGAAFERRAREPQDRHVGARGRRARHDRDAEPGAGQLDHGPQLAGLAADPWGEPELMASVLNDQSQTAAAREREHGLVAQFRQRDRLAPAECVAVMNADHERLDRDLTCVDRRRKRLRAEADDRGVDPAVGDGGERRLVLFVRDHDLDRGMGTVERPERGGEPVIDRPGDADAQAAAQQPAQRCDRVPAVLGRGERGAGMREERLAGPGERDSRAVAVEQRLAELKLEAADLRADRRLRHRDANRRTRELGLFGDRDEVVELPQIHNESLY